MNAIFQLINPNNTVTVNRPLAHELGLNEAVIYGALISKFYYYSEREMLSDGWFYSTAPDLQESTALSEKQQKRAIDKLVAAGLIRCELRGMPAKRSFYIIEDVAKLKNLLARGEEKMREIKPTAAERYEKKRQTSENPQPETQELMAFLSESFAMPESNNETAKRSDNTDCENSVNPLENSILTCSDKTAEQGFTKEQPLLRQNVGASFSEMSEQHLIKSKYNKPNIINPINQSPAAREDCSDRNEGMIFENNFNNTDERKECLEIIRKNIGYESIAEKEKTDELVGIMLDVICSQKETVRVNGGNISREAVKSRFMKLNGSHIDSVLNALKRSTSDIHNTRAYLITALYNAPLSFVGAARESRETACSSAEFSLCNTPVSPSRDNQRTSSSFDMDEIMASIIARYRKNADIQQ